MVAGRQIRLAARYYGDDVCGLRSEDADWKSGEALQIGSTRQGQGGVDLGSATALEDALPLISVLLLAELATVASTARATSARATRSVEVAWVHRRQLLGFRAGHLCFSFLFQF